jgi:hypothetical protein
MAQRSEIAGDASGLDFKEMLSAIGRVEGMRRVRRSRIVLAERSSEWAVVQSFFFILFPAR